MTRARIILARAPFVLALALLLTLVLARSSLGRLVPFDFATPPVFAYVFLALVAALAPALFARRAPLPAAALVAVPVLAVGAYGASRLDWLRLLKDFGVEEPGAIDPLRLAFSALALLALWALHAADVSVRLRVRAIERGIDPQDARTAARISIKRSAQAAGLAFAGAAGLLVVGLVGVVVGNVIPTQRGALVVPLLAAALLAAAAFWLTRGPTSRAR